MSENKSQLNILDRAISWLSPKIAYERASWRYALMRNYDSANFESRNSGWYAVNSPAEQTNMGSRDIIRTRTRDLERNSDIAEAIVGNIVRNTIGTGIKLQSKPRKKDGTEDIELGLKIEEYWNEWCKCDNCDITGRQSFHEMLAMAERRKIVDGGILFIKSFTGSGKFSFVLQPREVDDLDSTMYTNPENKNRVINGIELDKYNKPVAYWLKTVAPDGLWTESPKRITADRVIFLYDITRPSQVREISKLAPTAMRIRDINETVEAYSIKEYIQACLSVFIKKLNPSGTLGRFGAGATTTDTKTGYKFTKVKPGMIEQLEPGDDVVTVNPSGQAGNLREFVTVEQRLAGAGQGLSYEAVSRDMSQVNYSSARQGLLQDMITYGVEQLYLIEHFCWLVYITFVISLFLEGYLDIKDFWKNKDNYLRHDWVTPGQKWIDPLKEAKANEMALASGQTTLAEICASQGKDWREVLEQRAKEEAYAKELGLSISYSTGDTVIIDDTESNTKK